MKQELSLFGKNFKYVLALTFLAWFVYTMPAIKRAFSGISNLNTTQTELPPL